MAAVFIYNIITLSLWSHMSGAGYRMEKRSALNHKVLKKKMTNLNHVVRLHMHYFKMAKYHERITVCLLHSIIQDLNLKWQTLSN